MSYRLDAGNLSLDNRADGRRASSAERNRSLT